MTTHVYRPVGSCHDLFYCKDKEVLLSGAAGTGKSRGCMEKMHALAMRYPNSRHLIVRKTQESLGKSALATYQNFVAAEAIESGELRYHGGSRKEPAAFKYANGSVVLTGGMDKASRVMSTEFDTIYAQEATELNEDDWEKLTTRLRNNAMPYQQIIADCNPDAPHHWLKKRADAGKTTMILCRHEDNPMLFANGEWTEIGTSYIETLDDLTGVRRERLRFGKWAAAEGLVYDTYDPLVHNFSRVTPFPDDWPRYWGVDFGTRNPAVCQMWAMDNDGRLHLYRELYHSDKLAEDFAHDCMAAARNEPRPRAIVCDHDIEGRAAFEKATGMHTLPAFKAVSEGIEKVQLRLRTQKDGKPRIFFNEKMSYYTDPELERKKKPTSTLEEILSYAWDQPSHRGSIRETPVKADDHGMDAMRYVVAHIDISGTPRIRYFDI